MSDRDVNESVVSITDDAVSIIERMAWLYKTKDTQKRINLLLDIADICHGIQGKAIRFARLQEALDKKSRVEIP